MIMAEDTRDRVIALERDFIHLGELYETTVSLFRNECTKTERYRAEHASQHKELTKQIANVGDSINGGLHDTIREAIRDNMPTMIHRGWTMSDTVKTALISGGAIVLAKLIEMGIPILIG